MSKILKKNHFLNNQQNVVIGSQFVHFYSLFIHHKSIIIGHIKYENGQN